ncbi:hypothetical protein B566_EDAN013312, partial [Ephemera danica]
MDHNVSVVICNGMQDKAIKTILDGRKIGTFFTDIQSNRSCVDEIAENGAEKRAEAILKLAELLVSRSDELLAANALDLAEAVKRHTAQPLVDRLKLSEAKLNSLAT